MNTEVWNLRLLGECALSTTDGAPIALSTRKSLALLAYLVRQPERRAPRERLAALLWEDASPAQARLNLRKALSSLRQETRLDDRPEAVLLEANNDAIWLPPGAVAVDVDAFEAGVAADLRSSSTAPGVADLYAGDFLADFAIRGAPAFEAWAQVERQRLRELALAALTAMMEQALEPTVGPEVGVRAAMRVLAIDPLQERAHRALMRLYVRQGRRAAALKQFHALSELLSRELNTLPETETRELFREISVARHARTLEAPAPLAAGGDAPSLEPVIPETAVAPRRRRAAIAASALVGLAAVGGWLAFGDRLPLPASLRPSAQERSIAVLPFTTLGGESEAGALADGLTEEVINSLAHYPDLKVSGRTSAFYFKDKTPDLQEVGRKLGVAYVVKGSVRSDGDRLRVTAQLVEVANGFAVWSTTYDRRTTDAFAIQGELADAVANELKAASGAAARSARAPDPQSYRLYLVAKANLRDGGTAQLTTARRLFERQLALDPDNPRALAGYAQATISLAGKFELPFDTARQASEAAVARALLADPKSAEAYLARSRIEDLAASLTNQPGHAGQALAAARRAVELAPRNPEALTAYGLQLVIVNGAADEAIRILERAVELDPLQRSAQGQLGKSYRAAGLPRRAAEQYRATIELFPDYPEVRVLLGEVMYELGDAVAADRAYQDAAPALPVAAAVYRARLYANLQMNKDAAANLTSIRAPDIVPFTRALERHLARDYRGALALAEAEVARAPDSHMRDIVYANAAILGDYAKARRHMPELAPGLLSAQPDFPAAALDLATMGAHILNHTGEQAQARKVIARTLDLASPKPGRASLPWEWFARINAYAELGQDERALLELRRAIDAGFHDRVDESIAVRLEDWPSLRRLKTDVRFQRMIAEIEAGNSERRAKLLASRDAARRPPSG